MRVTLPNQGGMPEGKKFLGWWGAFGGERQKGIITYSISQNEQAAMRGAFEGYIFHGFKRIARHAPYFVPPFVVGYAAFQWAENKYNYLCSKEGHHLTMLEEEGGH
ncbi:Ubiquinol cytochrome c reductase, subunit QCR8 [Phaffia rhodozyma]|uniref:Cytochrome b-c1 complex subunit 8 n=1 Tax=Phaffia rhodozyma TaxID=264483 RepID=A0A0F7SN78_PHARH|nr:Ubiquinol cytochrome c reductase, subunit QCR8 [Phaffia rhodozyma]